LTSSSDRVLLPVRLTEASLVANSVRSLIIRRSNGALLPPWEAGAHVDLLLPGGETRQYSLCGDPEDLSHYRLAVRRKEQGRGGSVWIHDELAIGDIVRIRPPRNHFPLEPASRYVFVAFGIGVTPILPMLRTTTRHRLPWQLFYGGRSRESMAFLEEIERYGAAFTVASDDQAGVLDLPAIVDQLDAASLLYVCGPAGLVDDIKVAAEREGHGDRVRYELFDASRRDDEVETEERAFEVELARSGIVVSVAAMHSILEAVRAAGVDVASDCEDGICGSCETPVLSGRVEHRDHVLTRTEQQQNTCLMICVSRALDRRIVLDL
jgi:ferredoxin-NADP reductase